VISKRSAGLTGGFGRRLRSCRLGLVVLVSSLTRLVSAADATARTPTALSWVRAPGAEACASLRDVAARVTARLKRPAFVVPSDAEVLIEATISDDRPQGAFRVHIVLTNDARVLLGTRDLEIKADDCREATETAALAIALMIDPNAASPDSSAVFPVEPAVRSAPATGASLPAPPPAARPQVMTARPQPQLEHWRTRLGLGVLGSLGQLPRAALGALGSVRLSPQSGLAGIDVLARYLVKQDVDLAANVGGSFSASSVELAGFWAPLRGRKLVLSAAAGAELGLLNANGRNFAVTNDYRQSLIVNATLDGELGFRLAERFALLLRLGLKLPLARDNFEGQVDSKVVKIFKPYAAIADVSVSVGFDP